MLRHLDFAECEEFLDPFGLKEVRYDPVGNVLLMSGTPEQMEKASVALDIVDVPEDFYVERIGPASIVRTLPSNRHIALALGDIDIGTFDEPPDEVARSRGIIDIQGDAVVAFLPIRCRDSLRRLLSPETDTKRPQQEAPGRRRSGTGLPDRPGEPPRVPPAAPLMDSGNEPNVLSPAGSRQPRTLVTLGQDTTASDPSVESQQPETRPIEGEEAQTITLRLPLALKSSGATASPTVTNRAVPENGEDVLDMTLPETITTVQLLDLVGKHVGLNYVYDPREISNQPITLKLHGNLQGEMKVKTLYALLETVLEFMNLAMIRQGEGLVAVVPMDKALQTQPELVHVDPDTVQVGDTVVTRVFDIRYVDAASVMTLLQNMKLSVAATPLERGNLLMVTCHADRMNRIERLVEMIDRPGRPVECRLRRLRYVRATPLIARIGTLAAELKGVTIATTSSTPKAPTSPAKPATTAKPPGGAQDRPVYLDTDERTNRILMIGVEEELTLVEELIDVLDVAEEDPRSTQVYSVRHLDAEQALEKLEALEAIKTSPARTASAVGAGVGVGDSVLTGEPLVTILESTNQLVVRATPDQHARIREFLHYVDVRSEEAHTISAYPILHIDAHIAKRTLEELDLVSANSIGTSPVAGPNQPARSQPSQIPVKKEQGSPADRASIVVSETTNSLLVKATADQHARIAAIIDYIDAETPDEELAYQVYPLESSSPDHLSSLLERLVLEKSVDAEDKIESATTPQKKQERISIVPDPNTFSLIVYASQRNQQWIQELIERLDQRRPQVLIDVTLVEISRTDNFEYDLNLVASANDAVVGNIVIDSILGIDRGSRLEGGFNLPDNDGNPTGRTQVFYSDEKVQALLTAIQRKNYGRVLAKPKVLVDDGNKGQIVTTDSTTYVQESIQIPQTGTPITTRQFVSIDARIQLQITPHISEGNLLRLDVQLMRDDFGARPLPGAPPDKASSEVTTTVFVPDDRTVILGGLVKLNQSKGGSKVPLLGDIPLVGSLFRSVDNSDIEKKLYVFLKANIVRPFDESRLYDLERISGEHEEAFERSEREFQNMQTIPGIRPKPMPPEGVLRDYK